MLACSVRSAVIVVTAVVLALAQSPSGTITGTITDAQGARVPGVEVVALHLDTNLTYKATSSADGTYVIPGLPVGSYQVTATAPGFKAFRRADLVLEVAQRLRLDVALELGLLTETVTVTGEVPRVQTEDSALGAVVERARIEELPLNGRHVFNLVKLAAGVQPRYRNTDGFAEVTNQSFSQIRFNGGPVYGTQFFLDGAANSVPRNSEIAVVPMVDAVEEFRVDTNGMKAEFGQTSGGVVNVATKAGTNELHGSLYEFVRNDAMDARNAFATQVDRTTGRIKPILRYNQFGGTAGGPVWIPKLYNGKNRTFFFVGYEQWRFRNAELRRGTVPTAAERAGDFSNTVDGRGALIPLYDPATTRPNPAGSGFIRDVLPGNLVPRNRVDPLSLRVLEFMPQPNVPPSDPFTNSLNFLSLAASPIDQGITNLRVDHRFSDKDSLMFRYSVTRNTRAGEGYGLGPADPDTFARHDQRDNHNWLLTETRVITPNIINEFKAAATRQYLLFAHISYGGNWPEKLGMSKLIPRELFPTVNIAGMLNLGPGGSPAGFSGSSYVQLGDAVTMIRGRHHLKAGFEQRWMRMNWINRQYPSGQYQFAASLTGNPLRPAGTGFGTATFLLGEVSGGQLVNRPHFSFHSFSLSGYVQDDFKVTPRLTLNLGLRYDLTSSPAERWDRHSNFDPYLANPDTKMPGVMTYSGVTTPRNFVDRDGNNFGPRVGFAYDLTGDGKTAIRGAYGIVYLLSETHDMQSASSNALGFETVTTFAPSTLGPFKAFQFSQGPDGLVEPLGAGGGPSAFRGQGVQFQDRNAPSPYLQQWNFTLQRSLPGRWVVSASYAGNRGVKLFGANYDLNQIDPSHFSLRLALQDQVSNPFFGQITSGALSGRTTQRSQLLRPYPDYLGVSTFANHGGSSTYHSLQLTVERRFSAGVSAHLAYTNSKLINDSFSSVGNQQGGDFRIGRLNRRLDRAIDQDDISQRLVISGIYELPFGQGKPWLGNAKGVLRHVAGGWQINTITTLETGSPLSVRGASNFTGINWPDVIRDPTLPRSQRTLDRWFDPDAFRNPADFTIGNVPRTLPNTRGPGMFDMAFSAFKVFPIRETTNLEFRAEFFNAINHMNPNPPNTSFQPNPQGLNRNPNLGKITSALDARRIQLGLRLAF